MEKRLEFWSERWQLGDSPWHKDAVNGFLIKHFKQLTSGNIFEKSRIFVPLCGKTFDMKWIYDQGHTVVGVEGVAEPIVDFFREQGLSCEKVELSGGLTSYSTEDGRLTIYHCDLFSVDPTVLGQFDGIWDRGSLVALYPDSDRAKYAELLKRLLKENFFYLIDSMEYDQTKYAGPPRSVPVEEIETLFGDVCEVQVAERIDRNEDLSSPNIPKIRWNVDECYEIILVLTPKL